MLTAPCTQVLTSFGSSLEEVEGKEDQGASLAIFKGEAWQPSSFLFLRAGTRLPFVPHGTLCK